MRKFKKVQCIYCLQTQWLSNIITTSLLLQINVMLKMIKMCCVLSVIVRSSVSPSITLQKVLIINILATLVSLNGSRVQLITVYVKLPLLLLNRKKVYFHLPFYDLKMSFFLTVSLTMLTTTGEFEAAVFTLVTL